MKTGIVGYLSLLLRPFWRWWWSAVTGIASIASYVLAPEAGVTVPRWGVAAAVLVGFSFFFLALSVLTQGWELFQGRQADLRVRGIPKCSDYGGEYIFLLEGHISAQQGTILEILRPLGDAEAPFALVELLGRNA